MPVTRSQTRTKVTNNGPMPTAKAASAKVTGVRNTTRKASRGKKGAPSSTPTNTNIATASEPVPDLLPNEHKPSLVPAVLTFSFEEAKKHLINADARFEDIFQKMPCRPYEHLDSVHPFRELCTSILGQQISWMAARSIRWRFIRLYFPSLPEKPTDHDHKTVDVFPSPRRVALSDIDTLKTAGLSTRKAEYVRDLALRFADGRLSTEKLLKANDEQLAETLMEVRGVGRWTVDMFAIFSLRRPDILPVGDLGVQRGVARWFLALHSSALNHQFGLSPHKLPASSTTTTDKPKKAAKKPKKKSSAKDSDDEADMDDELPIVGLSTDAADVSAMPPAPEVADDDPMELIPPAFTPSIKKTLNKVMAASKPPLPEGLSVSVLKSRLDGKKVKGCILTPQEMEALTEPWKPYRSLAVYYMWSLAEADV